MANKNKGTKHENELFDLINQTDWRVVRTAGSGTKRDADCDLIAGKNGNIYVIEVKSTKKKEIYISKNQIDRLQKFSKEFGAIPFIALRFPREKFRFCFIEDGEIKKNSIKFRKETSHLTSQELFNDY